ncbi:MAG: LysM peptidoglycan-binding domain-containing protein [Planctomycetaceae bacterium]|nr:LysM peptidoglycan-binding domain-containing protein [Planctomycetaceae bacterium]
MLNRNSARHLLLIVSILLCFFVYLGYRLLGSGDRAEPVLQCPPFEPEIASPVSAPDDALRPPTDVSVPIDDDDTAWVSSVPSSPVESPVSAPSDSFIPAPTTSTASAAPVSTAHSGAITGLIPAPPADDSPSLAPPDDSAPASGLPVGLPIPSDDLAAAPSAGASLPLPTATGLRPPGVDDDTDAAPSYLPPPAASTPAPAGSLSGTRVSPPPSTTTAPPAPAAASVAPPGVGTAWSDDYGYGDDYGDDSAGAADIPSPPSTRTPLPDDSSGPAEAAPERQGPSPYGPYQELPESLRIYVVLPGDSLSSIAVRELGSASLAENIFLLNRDVIEDPDHLLAGVKIRLPVRESATVDEPAPPDTATPGRRPSMGLGRTHLVVRGDTLSSIAQQYYGTSAGWRFIYEANRNILPNPNVLAVGNELTIPPYEE